MTYINQHDLDQISPLVGVQGVIEISENITAYIKHGDNKIQIQTIHRPFRQKTFKGVKHALKMFTSSGISSVIIEQDLSLCS